MNTTEINTIFLENTGLIKSAINKFFFIGGSYTREDLYQEGSIGLLGAIKSYDSKKCDRFCAYAYLCIYRAIKNSIYSNSFIVKLPYNNKTREKHNVKNIFIEANSEEIINSFMTNNHTVEDKVLLEEILTKGLLINKI